MEILLAKLLIHSNGDIFHEIKKIRGKSNNFSSRIDDMVGPNDIANHFSSIYEELYNRVDLDDDFKCIQREIISSINDDSYSQYHRITEDIVKEAFKRLKPKKSDAVFNMTSDFYLHSSPELVSKLTDLMKLYFSHGYIPHIVLLCQIVPLLKDNLGDISSSSNYRGIAGGCLLLKLIDLVIIILESDKLNYDCMQFAYQQKSSTTMCSWTVKTVVEYFNRGGNPVYAASMDMSKAFDLVSWEKLFRTLIDRKINCLFLRVLIFVYTDQECYVKWCGAISASFAVKNGVRQGAVSSGILFAVYIDDLLTELRNSRLGCHIHGIFYGAQFFADDLILLSASRCGLQHMVDICQNFVSSRNLSFGTNIDPQKSKTKCLVFSRKNTELKNLKSNNLDGNNLPWVESVKHLGHILQNDNSMRMDMAQKRGIFIGKTNSLLQEFSNVSPNILLKLFNATAMTFYGSNLWDLFSKNSERVYKSYNVAIRNILHLDRCTHRFLIEPLSNSIHLKTALASKFVSFHNSLITSSKKPVRFLARLVENDHRTVHGRNLSAIVQLCDMKNFSDLKPKLVKEHLSYMPTPEAEKWKSSMCKELLRVRGNDIEIPGFTNDEEEYLLKYLCTT